MAWLLGADPRGDDLDAPGSEIDTNHEGRIEGRLRQNIDKWRAITKDERVLDLILNGLKLEFVDGREPPELLSDRNSIPPELEGWTAQQIEAMLQAGAICTWDEHADMLRRRGLNPGDRPRVISPILVHEKPSSTPENRKYRFIVDARELNVHLIKRKFKTYEKHHPLADRNLAAGDFFQARHHAQQGRLATSRGTDDDHKLAIFNMRAHAVNHLQLLLALWVLFNDVAQCQR
jgi:hypothetical protein